MDFPSVADGLLVEVHAENEWRTESAGFAHETLPAGMVAEDVSDDELLASITSGGDDTFRFLDGRGERFLDEDMRAGGEGRKGVRRMGIDVRVNGDEIRVQGESFFEVGEERIGS